MNRINHKDKTEACLRTLTVTVSSTVHVFVCPVSDLYVLRSLTLIPSVEPFGLGFSIEQNPQHLNGLV